MAGLSVLILIALFLALIGPGAFFWTLPNDRYEGGEPRGGSRRRDGDGAKKMGSVVWTGPIS